MDKNRKKVPIWLLYLLIILWMNFTVVFGWAVLHANKGGTKLGQIGEIALTIASYPSMVKDALNEFGVFVQFFSFTPLVIDDRFPEIDGFKRNNIVQDGAKSDEGYLLLSSFDDVKMQFTVKLIQIANQKELYEWAPSIHQLRENQETEGSFFELNHMEPNLYQITHPLLLDDGGIVFNNQGPLYKINACSNHEWTANGVFHHSNELDSDNAIWVPSVLQETAYDKYKFLYYRDDAIAKVSLTGEVLYKKSVSKILEENGYRTLMFGIGPYEADTIHLNDIQPAQYSTEYWEKGDLLLSVRNRSTVFIYRPSTEKIIWLMTGPWLNQHDVDFIGLSKISVFNNNMIRAQTENLVDGHNNIFVVDLADGSVSDAYTTALENLDVHTKTAGRGEILDNGDLFIEETNDGRLLRISSDNKLVWEFVSKAANGKVRSLSWSRYLTENQVKDILPILKRTSCQ
jgi:hypothetical protein